jgi:flagellar biosynthesis protein FliQ
MSIRLQIAALVYLMVQAMMFGIGIVLVLATPLKEMAMTLLPGVVLVSAILSLPLSWLIAPRLQARYWRRKGIRSDVISGPDEATQAKG